MINEEVYLFDGKYILNKNGQLKSYKFPDKPLKGSKDKDGWYIHFRIFGKKYYLHRLLAEYFIANPDNKKYVNHKNGIKDDNTLDNLEWCTSSENNKHAHNNGLNFRPHNSGKPKRKIVQYDYLGNLIKVWDSVTDASNALCVDKMSIVRAAQGKFKHSKGFKWQYL